VTTIAFVGAGPRTIGLLERLAANLSALPAPRLRVHVVDPYPPGGRVWRPDQSPLLWMNSRAGEVTMFPDDTVRCAGPVRTGPTLAQWAGLPSGTFPSRRAAGRYLRWCFGRIAGSLPSTVDIVQHRTRAVRLCGRTVELADGDRVETDLVVLAQGNIDGRDERYGAGHLPPAYTADADLSFLPAGADVIVRGLGLAFVDLMMLLTEGRGGTFHRGADGVLRYRRGGAEPVLWAGSRRGVPYLPKPDPAALTGPPPPSTGPAPGSGSAVPADPDAFWPAVCKELGWAYYHELCATRRDRTAMPWPDFAGRYASLAWGSDGMRALVAEAVPDPADRFDPDALADPLAGKAFASEEALAGWLRRRIAGTVAAPDRYAAILPALLRIGDRLSGPALGRLAKLSAFLGSGPPPYRLEQLCALSRAGVVRFLGRLPAVTVDGGMFVAHSATLRYPVTARFLVDARLPDDDVRCGDPLLAGLVRDGAAIRGGRLAVDPDTFQVLDTFGRPHPERLALGAFATAGRLGSFARPRSDAAFFRQNDAVARWLLHHVSASTRR